VWCVHVVCRVVGGSVELGSRLQCSVCSTALGCTYSVDGRSCACAQADDAFRRWLMRWLVLVAVGAWVSPYVPQMSNVILLRQSR
jgi:hypothetical protein